MVSTVKKSEARMPLASARRKADHVGPERLGLGPSPFVLSSLLTVVAPMRTPSFLSSPWIRTYPHLGFSRPRRSTRSRTSGSIGGRPGLLERSVHFRLTSSRCHRGRVCGVTRNEDQRARETRREAAARKARSIGRKDGRATCRRRTLDLTAQD